MDKNHFLNSIDYEDKNLLSSIFNKMQIAEKTNKIIFTNDFLSPAIWSKVLVMCDEFKIKGFSNGIFQDADRRILGFSSYIEPTLYPISLLKIINKSKFSELYHKDYLGAIMSLGIKREKLGDLVIQDGICYAPVFNDISDYIINNLNSVRNCPCEVVEYDYNLSELPKRKYEEKVIISTSLRLDSVVSAITNVSRANAVELISSGKVLVDYVECLKKDKTIKNSDVLTIRSYGKFKISEVIGMTQKDRLKILINKYI